MLIDNQLSAINSIVANYLNKETTKEEVEMGLSNILSETDNISEDIEVLDDKIVKEVEALSVKEFKVSLIKPDKEVFFGVRTYPEVNDVEDRGLPFSLLQCKLDREKFLNDWRRYKKWVVEIDMRLFGEVAFLSPEEITALIIFDVLNTVFTDDSANLLYDTYIMNYIPESYYERLNIDAIYILYNIPLLAACFAKNWLEISSKDNIDQISILKNDSSNDITWVSTYQEALISCLGKVIKNMGNNNLVTYSSEKYDIVGREVLNMNRYANDFGKRRMSLRDDMIIRSIQTDSLTLKTLYLNILNSLGVELREKYTGSLYELAIESLNEDIVTKYELLDTTNSALESVLSNAKNKYRMTIDKISKGITKLPADKDIDLIFVEIDKIENHFDRKFVLDRIYRLQDAIITFEEVHADEPDVLKKYSRKIESMMKMLDNAREEVLNKRAFSKKYKIFVDVPSGYEG